MNQLPDLEVGELAKFGDVPDALIYCTDGYGTFPSEPPEEFPVLWVLTHVGQQEDRVPFGSVLRMPRAARSSEEEGTGANLLIER